MIKRCVMAIVVFNVVCMVRMGLLLTIALWTKVFQKSPMAMMVIEHLSREVRKMWREHGLKQVPQRYRKYLPDGHSEFSDDCDFLENEEEGKSLNVNYEVRQSFFAAGGMYKVNQHQRPLTDLSSSELRQSCTGGYPMTKTASGTPQSFSPHGKKSPDYSPYGKKSPEDP